MASTPAHAAAPAAPGKMKKIIMIALIAVVAASGAGAGVWFFMGKHAAAPHADAPPPPPPAPTYFPLDAMTVNLLSDDGQQHFLRIGLSLKIADPKTQQQITEHMPEIRSHLLLALSNKHPEELATLDGKRALATELKKLIEEPGEKNEPSIHVQDVLFTDFVVQ